MNQYSNIPTDEQETTISYSRTDAAVFVWTNDRTVMTRLDKLCSTAPDCYSCTNTGRTLDGAIMDKRYFITDKGLLSFRSGRQKKSISPEQLEKLRERGRKIRAAQLSNFNSIAEHG